MLFWKLLGGIAAKVGLGLSLLFSPGMSVPYPTPLVLAPDTPDDASIAATPVQEGVKEPKQKPEPVQTSPSALPSAPKPLSAPVPKPQAPVVDIPLHPTPAPLPEPPLALLPPGSNLNDLARAALVNILCTTKGGGYLKPISGSGVIIDSRGIVLTNAHVGQFFLLKDYLVEDNVVCVIRTGSPARTLYTAQLLYFPPAWMAANASKITQQIPTGTGRNDYAFLRITGRTDPSASLPSSFPYLPPTGREPAKGEAVLLAGYPAGFLEGETVQTALYISTASTVIGDIFTFEQDGGSDLISVSGTILSQHGSSGGAVISAKDASVIGAIVTATTGGTTAERDLRAITLRHIGESYKAETGMPLDALFSGDIAQKAAVFNLTVAPSLSRALIEELEK